MKVDPNEILQFILKWLAIGAVIHFGLALGAWIDGFLPNLPA